MTSLNRKKCHDIDGPVAREWLVTNGLGGYASGTVAGLLNRRYHGLMVVPVHPPLGRYLVFAKADAVAIGDDGGEIPLHSNRWGGGWVEPRGHERLESFRLDRQLPVWRYAVAGRILEQRIWMPHGRHQVSVAYRLVDGDPLRLRVGLIASYRDHHAVNGYPGPALERTLTDTGLKVGLPEDQTLSLASDNGEFSTNDDWVDNFFLVTEHERGLEDSDRHPRIAYLELEATTDDWHGVGIALNDSADTAFAASLDREQRRIEGALANALPGVAGDRVPDWIGQLLVASDSYLFRRQGGDGEARDSVIAGYPWFGDWGRDTMIALPGLTLATGRPALARAILDTFAGYVHDGLLPNVFPGAGETPDYNSVDAALWFIEAWRAYLEATEDKTALRRAFPALVRIVAAYRGGTRFGIRIDPADGLVQAGALAMLSVLLIQGALALPMDLWRTFRLEQRFGFNRTDMAQYVKDKLLGIVLALALGGPLLLAILWLMERAGELWWLYAWALWMAFTLFISWLYPTLIAPLFNKFEPLSEGELKERIQGLVERCGFASKGIFVMDGSRRSAHGNAYFTGFGRNKRIVFFDTLVDSLGVDELEAVLAHELGHFKHRHVQKGLLLSAVMTLLAFAVLGWLMQQAWFYTGLGVEQQSNAAALLLFLMVSPAFTWFLTPLGAWLMRRHEFQADEYAVNQSGGQPLIRALVKLYQENASTLTPDPLFSAFHDSHPPAPVRIAHISAKIAEA